MYGEVWESGARWCTGWARLISRRRIFLVFGAQADAQTEQGKGRSRVSARHSIFSKGALRAVGAMACLRACGAAYARGGMSTGVLAARTNAFRTAATSAEQGLCRAQKSHCRTSNTKVVQHQPSKPEQGRHADLDRMLICRRSARKADVYCSDARCSLVCYVQNATFQQKNDRF